MAQVTFTKAIESISGAIDSVKQGQVSRMRLVVRRHDYGEGRNYDHEGHKIHELYYYRMHEGAWCEGATKNRDMRERAQAGQWNRD